MSCLPSVVHTAVAACLLAAAATPVHAELQRPDGPLTPCRLAGIEHDALCGVVRRPLDAAQPTGKAIDVHFAVLPALARNRRPDPVFFLAGGPGQSAVALAGPVAGMLARLSNRRDIVLIDQRGTGRSAPLACDADDPLAPLAEQGDASGQQGRMAACLRRLQALAHGDLRHYGTAAAMADADAVRVALGADRVNLVGISYGTRAALEYQRQFPQHVRRTVLDGVAPPDMRLPRSFAADNQRALDAVFTACDADAACRSRHPSLRARWQALLASLPRAVTVAHPVHGRAETFVLTRQVLLGWVRAPLYVPALAAALPAALDAAADGRLEALAALASSLAMRRDASFAAGMHFSVVCSEDVPAGAPPAPGAQPAAGDFGDTFERLYAEICADWPRAMLPAGWGTIPPAPSATLLLSGGADPATPPRHGERVRASLGALARHVVVPQAGHGVLGLRCMGDVVFRFIDADTDAQALAVDASCVDAVPRPAAVAWPPRQAGGLP